VSERDGITVAIQKLRNRPGVVGVSDKVRQRRLMWYGHAEHKDADDWVSACRNIAVSEKLGRGRKACKECGPDDMRQLNLRKEDAQNRVVWKNGILRNRPTAVTMTMVINFAHLFLPFHNIILRSLPLTTTLLINTFLCKSLCLLYSSSML
jgi:hypothetical protein